MTVQGRRAARPWQDTSFARAWSDSDTLTDLLRLPRAIAAALVAQDEATVGTVLDVASGPGAFLATFLDAFPHAVGVWLDASEAMHEQATANLDRFGERVRFVVGDMTALRASGVPEPVDVVTTSRATHHLDRPGLHAFYAEAAGLLAPGGWLINLDHIGPSDVWDRRLRAIRPRFLAPVPDEPKHHHDYPLAGVRDHLDALARAGLDDNEVAWRAFYTCLFAARRNG